MSQNLKKTKIFWLDSDGINNLITMKPLGRKTIEKNSTIEDILYLVDNRSCLCPHGKFHTLTARKRRYIYTTL